MSYQLDSEKVYSRIKLCYNYLMGNGTFSNLKNQPDAMLFLRGKVTNEIDETQNKTSQLFTYLLGYDFSDTILLFTPGSIIFFLSSKKKAILETLDENNDPNLPKIKIYLRNPKGDNTQAIGELFQNFLSEFKKDKIKLGILKSEPGIGQIRDEWNNEMKKYSNKIINIDMPYFLDEIFSVKTKEEIDNIQIASKYACTIVEYLNRKFERIIEAEKKITHLKISEDIKKDLLAESNQKKILERIKLPNAPFEKFELISSPIIQSGGKYLLEKICSVTNSELKSDIIICKANTSFNDYNANVIRTFMIDVDKDTQNIYKILMEAFNILLANMEPGKKIKDAYNAVINYVSERKDFSLVDKLPASFGKGIGFEISNELLDINKDNDTIIKVGMCFNVILSISGIKQGDVDNYCIQIGDTVAIKENEKGECVNNFTKNLSKSLSEILYNMDENESNSEEDERKKNKRIMELAEKNPDKRITRGMENSHEDRTKLVKRQEHQNFLLEKKNEEFRERMIENPEKINLLYEEDKDYYSKIKCYESVNDLPPNLPKDKISFDKKNFTIFLPIMNQVIPFHISLIKNTTKSDDDHKVKVLRINFLIPAAFKLEQSGVKRTVYLKDISYRHKDAQYINTIINEAKELKKSYNQKLQENKEKGENVIQDKLILNKGKRNFLADVNMRPVFQSQKKTLGTLEAHQNGLRFTSNKNEKLDIIYSNIKHAIYQPCDNEALVIIHFHLKNAIQLGKKKEKDIQFCREVCTQADELDGKRNRNDYDELEQELLEKQNKEKVNDEFYHFARDVPGIEFDVPFRELEFTGVPYRSNVSLIPTKYCLVSLIDMPFFIATLKEIDVVYFERVSNQLKNFDMNLIFKDLTRPVQRITTIPTEYLDTIKTWLDDNDILFGEGIINMVWSKILYTIRHDPENFLNDGGWSFLLDNGEDDDDEDEKQNDSDYIEDEDESEYDDDDEDYSESDYEDDEESGEASGDDELSEKGVDWEEMSEKAAREDREAARKKKEEDERRGKKKGKK